MVVAVVLWLGTAAAAWTLLPDMVASYYGAGYAVGAAVGGLFLAAVIRLIYVRLTPWGRGLPDFAPALFVLAAAITALGIGGRYVAQERDVDRYTAAADECAVSHTSPLSDPPKGLSTIPIPPVAQARFDELVAGTIPDEVAARLELRQIVADGRVAAVAMVMPGLTGTDRADFEAGITAGAASQGGVAENAVVGSSRAIVVSSPMMTAVATYPGCWGLVVFGRDREEAEGLTRALLISGGAQPPAAAAASSSRSSPQNT